MPYARKRLRVSGVGQVEAVPPIVNREEEDPLGLGQHSHGIQYIGKPRTCPLGDEWPSFFAGLMGDLAVHGEALQIGHRERPRPLYETSDGHLPTRKVIGLQPLVGVRFRSFSVHRNHFRDLAAVEFACQPTVREQEAMRNVGERLSYPVNSAMVGWLQAVSVGKIGRNTQTGSPGS